LLFHLIRAKFTAEDGVSAIVVDLFVWFVIVATGERKSTIEERVTLMFSPQMAALINARA